MTALEIEMAAEDSGMAFRAAEEQADRVRHIVPGGGEGADGAALEPQ